MRLSFLITPILLTAVTIFDGFALPSGITGRTLKPGSVPGCALRGCHGGAEVASVTIKAPACLQVNQVARCTVLVVGNTTGIDISASDGVLTPVSRLIAVNEELTHPSPGSGVYVFDYRAPATPGTQTLFATGQSGGTSGPWGFATNKVIYIDLVASVKESSPPSGFSLGQNFPNPFNPSTVIEYTIAPERDEGPGVDVKLVVYDLLGQEVATLVDERKGAGTYQVRFSAGGGSLPYRSGPPDRDSRGAGGAREQAGASGGREGGLASGVYIYRLSGGSFIESRTMLLIR